jgi:hypothetical protein
LQRDDQIPPLLLELDKRQTVIRQISHDDIPTASIGPHRAIADRFCDPITKLRQILTIRDDRRSPRDRIRN